MVKIRKTSTLGETNNPLDSLTLITLTRSLDVFVIGWKGAKWNDLIGWFWQALFSFAGSYCDVMLLTNLLQCPLHFFGLSMTSVHDKKLNDFEHFCENLFSLTKCLLLSGSIDRTWRTLLSMSRIVLWGVISMSLREARWRTVVEWLKVMTLFFD